MELRSTKLNSKNPIKYPLFVISKNLLNSKGLFDFPIVNSKNKSKEFRIYKKNKQKDKDFIKFQNIKFFWFNIILFFKLYYLNKLYFFY